MLNIRKRRKRGSYRSKHRNNVSRWHENVVAFKYRRIRKKTPMYESVEEAMNQERKRRKGRKTKESANG